MYRNYKPVDRHWAEMHNKYKPLNVFKRKVLIKKIKIDKSSLNFPNEVDMNEVFEIALNFYQSAWEPIWVNPDYFLIDGKHRLEAARQMGLKYIDVVIHDESKEEEYAEKNKPILPDINKVLGASRKEMEKIYNDFKQSIRSSKPILRNNK